ncbi:MAG: ferrochelatase, partial [Alphaproteobacteria bacterium]
MKDPRIAVILFNLGGPDRLSAVRPFLINLFSDLNIISAPGPVRWLLARLIAWRRTVKAQEIYSKIGGGSPIVAETQKQADALQELLRDQGFNNLRCCPVMRYWNPRAQDAVRQVKYFAPEHVVLLPLYPQFSTTTTLSSLQEWRVQSQSAGLDVTTHEICCYPDQPDFIAAHAAMIRAQAPDYFGPEGRHKARLLFSAHGLPQR